MSSSSRDHAPSITAVESGQAHTSGPYWVWETHTEAQVRGRYGKIIRRYPLDQLQLAEADARRLQRAASPSRADKIRDLVEIAKDAADWLCEADEGSDPWERGQELRAAIAKASA